MAQISIELESGTLDKLCRLAESEQKTMERIAAELLTERIENAELTRLRLEIRRLRDDIALSTQALLVTGNGIDDEEARAWVRNNLGDR